LSQKTHSTLIGGFVIGALALAMAAIFLLSGGDLWKKKSRYVMYFEGSVYGLQVGAPVVFRGVTIGTVKHIGIALDTASRAFYVPVEAELFSTSASDLEGRTLEIDSVITGEQLVKNGLRAQLAMQSLLTGQLYIDLDFHTDTADTLRLQGDDGVPEIPTVPTPVQRLKRHFENIDVEKLVQDISAVAASLRSRSESKELDRSLATLARTLDNIEKLTARLEQGSGPLLADAHDTLKETRQAMHSAQEAMRNISTLASEMRESTADNSLLQQNIHRALKETTRAATAVRQLSESIERQPESLLRGRTGE